TPEDRHVDARVPQIRGDVGIRHGDEPDARILHFAPEDVAHLLDEQWPDALLSCRCHRCAARDGRRTTNDERPTSNEESGRRTKRFRSVVVRRWSFVVGRHKNSTRMSAMLTRGLLSME